MINNQANIKKQLRHSYLCKRKELYPEQVIESSAVIVERILKSDDYQNADTIFAYYPSNKECNILDVVRQAIKEGKRVAFPKSLNQRHMDFLQVPSIDTFKKGRFNIMEPTTNHIITPNEHTMVLVPGIVFDTQNYRIGYGGGYYDAYFRRFMHSELKKIGVYYHWQQTPTIPVEEHDIPLDYIIDDYSES